MLRIRELAPSERAWVATLLAARWGDRRVVSRGRAHDATTLAGLVAERHGERVGLATLRFADGACEIVTLDALEPRRGVGRALLEAALEQARDRGCRRVWLVTTRGKHDAQAFYAACGWEQVATHRGAVALARRRQPSIPERDGDGAPIEDEDELEFERRL